MHGIVFGELKHYVAAKLGEGAWRTLLRQAGFGARIYIPIQPYPDGEFVALVEAVSSTADVAIPELLEDFGAYLVPTYFKLYGHLVPAGWRALDVIEHAEEVVHRVVRIKTAGAAPPELDCTRLRDDEVLLRYRSGRKLCAVARGIARGVGRHYGETISTEERHCMLDGASECEILVATA